MPAQLNKVLFEPAFLGVWMNVSQEIVESILLYLPFQEICQHVSKVSSAFYRWCQSGTLWKAIYTQHYPEALLGRQAEDPYQILFISRKIEEQQPKYAQLSQELKSQFLEMESAFQLMQHSSHSASSPSSVLSAVSPTVDPLVQQCVINWKKLHPSVAALSYNATAHQCTHTCPFTYYEALQLYICNQTGAFHQCGLACDRAVHSDQDDGFRVCPISGRMIESAAHMFISQDTQTDTFALQPLPYEDVNDTVLPLGNGIVSSISGTYGKCWIQGYAMAIQDEERYRKKRRCR